MELHKIKLGLQHGEVFYCPHTTNPLQIKSLCKRCVKLEDLNINIYQTPWSDWACSLPGKIADGFTNRYAAEQWALDNIDSPPIEKEG